jgi:energy-coupling factor transporter ATP-binding protein EcfA2
VAATARTELASRVGLVFQDPSSQLVMERVEDDVAFGLENRGWSWDRMHDRVPTALTATGLDGLARHRSRRLSGGQGQRLALAGVLAAQPGLLVLDEPTANLDPDGAAAFVGRLRELREARSTTIVLIEHRVEIAWPLADRVLALDGAGRQIDLGRPEEVLSRSRASLRLAGIWLPDEATTGRRASDGADTRPRDTTGHPPVVDADGVSFGYDSGSAWPWLVRTEAASPPWADSSWVCCGRGPGGSACLAMIPPVSLRPSWPAGPPTSSRSRSASSWPAGSGMRCCWASTPRLRPAPAT